MSKVVVQVATCSVCEDKERLSYIHAYTHARTHAYKVHEYAICAQAVAGPAMGCGWGAKGGGDRWGMDAGGWEQRAVGLDGRAVGFRRRAVNFRRGGRGEGAAGWGGGCGSSLWGSSLWR